MQEKTIIERIKQSLDAGWSIRVACRQAGIDYSTFYKRSFVNEEYREISEFYSKKYKEITRQKRPYKPGLNS